MNELTEKDVAAGVAVNSEQLNAEDLLSGPVEVTITAVELTDDKEQPWSFHMAEYPVKKFLPCLTMRRLILVIFDTKIPKRWIGHRLTLYRADDVRYMSETVGGVRISHCSAITKPVSVPLTDRRGSKTKWTVLPMTELTPEDQKFIADATEELKSAASLEVLNGYGQTLKTKSKNVQDALRPIYAKRLEELAPKGESP